MRTTERTDLQFTAVNPSSGERFGHFRSAGPEEVAAAARAALQAGSQETLLDYARRASFLEAAARALRVDEVEIVATAGAETGLARGRLEGELERTAGQLEAFAALIGVGDYVDAYIDPPDPAAKPIPRPDLRRMLIPIGPVAVFGASNFPLAFSVAGGDTASALAAGCPVVVKGHPAHPGTCELVGAAIHRAAVQTGMPPGTFAVLTSSGQATGEVLVKQPEIAAVAFTGSFAAGAALLQAAAARPVPIPVFAEMSSVNPLVLTSGALAARFEEIASGLTTAISNSAGQLCTKPGLVFLPAGEAGDELKAAVASTLAEQASQVMLSEGIRDAFLERVRTLERLSDPLINAPTDGDADAGFRAVARAFATTAEALAAEPELRAECFGPAALFVEYDDSEDLLAALAALDGQLTATLHMEADEIEWVRPVVAAMQRIAGRLIFNGYPTGVSVTSAMHHGGPFPATTNVAHTSVGMTAVSRFLRPLAWQNAPTDLLPLELRETNPRGIARRVAGRLRLS